MFTVTVPAKFRRKRSKIDPSSEQQFGGSSSSLPEEMIFEILTRLPVKSLMRFKSVSKSWNSIITHPSFADAHRSPSPSADRAVVIMDPDPSQAFAGRESPSHFFYADINEVPKKKGSSTVDVSLHLSVPENLKYFAVTNIVNGLVCFYNRNVSKMLNIATREIVDLPDSNYAYKHCFYHLGFDPADKSYKLLKICPVYEDFDEEDDFDAFEEGKILPISMECEILTLGKDNSWRIIRPPPCPIRRNCLLCVKDGVLYWKFTYKSGIDTKRVSIAFNLTRERFQNFRNLSPKHLALYDDKTCRVGLFPEGKVLIFGGKKMLLIDDHEKKKGGRVVVEKIMLNKLSAFRIGMGTIFLYEENLISLKHLINNM
ncbi:hypothetical protein M9H77_20157 [Catharanthus roseus]|uniref:Uncharacterized protein n=1 Tax=Catharanthus roseus TaxID=4058 RepID=A0ACC0AJ36_CATRO|nr:hypothetical protein M9H77_20157 [Catharanthus roseus]